MPDLKFLAIVGLEKSGDTGINTVKALYAISSTSSPRASALLSNDSNKMHTHHTLA